MRSNTMSLSLIGKSKMLSCKVTVKNALGFIQKTTMTKTDSITLLKLAREIVTYKNVPGIFLGPICYLTHV